MYVYYTSLILEDFNALSLFRPLKSLCVAFYGSRQLREFERLPYK